jgi:lipoprotein-anchoring transpeptidase ErfK/SrfK/predicted negative regulator of RcsB-dependent stress response
MYIKSSQKKEELSLTKIILFICVALALGFGVMKFSQWFSSSVAGGTATEETVDAVEEARKALEAGEYERVKALLDPVAVDSTDPIQTPQVLVMLARAERAAGNDDAAMQHLQLVMKDYAQSPVYAEAALLYAGLLEQQGQTEQASAIYRDVQTSAPRGLRAGALTGLGREAARGGDLIRAREFYQQAVRDATWGSPTWLEAVQALGDTNIALIFSPTPTPDSKAYLVRPGDTLTAIGNALNIPQGMLIRANVLDNPANLRPGQQLKYTAKDFRIIVERQTCRIFLLDKDGIFKMYGTGLGKPGHETTLGSYKIGNKQKDPTWFKPGAGPIPAGNPENELGTRWMPLVPDAPGLPTDLGIHGTIEPDSIGKYVSAGCPRMHNAEVEELYDLVVRSTPVTIVEVLDPAEWGLA